MRLEENNFAVAVDDVECHLAQARINQHVKRIHLLFATISSDRGSLSLSAFAEFLSSPNYRLSP